MERKALIRVAGFMALLVAVFAFASIAGGAIDPEVDEPVAHGEETQMDMAVVESTESHSEVAPTPSGLAVAQDGYRLVPADQRAKARRFTPFSFEILDPAGEPVTEFDEIHERDLHLIAIRRDLTGFQHLHPEMNARGAWKATIDTSEPGTYRVFADFSVGGEPMTLGTDLSVPGRAKARIIPPPVNEVGAGPGFRVELSRKGSQLSFDVRQNGLSKQVDPYLGADGHLVALREHDLAFVHAHPKGRPGGSGPIEFEVDFPSDGRYRLFLQFMVDGKVHTAPFTVKVDAPGTEASHGDAEEEAHDGGH